MAPCGKVIVIAPPCCAWKRGWVGWQALGGPKTPKAGHGRPRPAMAGYGRPGAAMALDGHSQPWPAMASKWEKRGRPVGRPWPAWPCPAMAGHGRPWHDHGSSWLAMAGRGRPGWPWLVRANHGHGQPWPALASHTSRSSPQSTMASYGWSQLAIVSHR